MKFQGQSASVSALSHLALIIDNHEDIIEELHSLVLLPLLHLRLTQLFSCNHVTIKVDHTVRQLSHILAKADERYFLPQGCLS
mmetsp:Transcript_25321/g.66453  ORF Transcript_25321/g.66453 Transcript_25321/m.66453 type:complete len:83 (-) Transcript_25321:442-690(-)